MSELYTAGGLSTFSRSLFASRRDAKRMIRCQITKMMRMLEGGKGVYAKGRAKVERRGTIYAAKPSVRRQYERRYACEPSTVGRGTRRTFSSSKQKNCEGGVRRGTEGRGGTHVVVDSTKVRVVAVVVRSTLVVDDAEELVLVK